MHIETTTRRLTRLLAMSASLVLVGCAAMGPNYTQPAIDMPATWNRLDPAA